MQGNNPNHALACTEVLKNLPANCTGSKFAYLIFLGIISITLTFS